jgi:putative DNA primase/helicase
MTRPEPHNEKRRPGGSGVVSYDNTLNGCQFTTTDPRVEFAAAMANVGIICTEPDRIAGDGTLTRFNVEGDRPGTRNGWAVLHLAPVPAGAFGNWRIGASGTWRSGSGRASRGERARLDRAVADARAEQHRARQAAQDAARARAGELWAKGTPVDSAHAYLLRKGVTPSGVRQLGELLMVPMRDAEGVLWSVQFIGPDGQKRFLKSGRKLGLYFSLGGPVLGHMAIAEGLATAASIHAATGWPTACAFDAGNLEPVAVALRAKYPTTDMVVAADGDAVGIAKATAAALRIDGRVALPPGVRHGG